MACGLRTETQVLAEDYLRLCCSPQARGQAQVQAQVQARAAPCGSAALALRRLGQDMEAQHQARFLSLSQSFLKQCGPDPCSSLRRVMEELVGDEEGLNWGRVVSLFTFAGVLARQMQEQRGRSGQDPGKVPPDCRRLAETIADYLGEEKRDWLLDHGGWEGFCEFSCVSQKVEQDSTMKTALFAAAGVGLAGLTFLLVR